MGTAWIYRYGLFVADADRAAANALAAQLDPDTGGASTFVLGLSADGSAPAARWGAWAPATEAIHRALAAALAAGQTPGSLVFYRTDAPTGVLRATNSPTAAGRVGSPWAWADCLADLGLAPAES
jgi:hypothetical protein